MPAPRGTGFFVDGAGHFITAAHVVRGLAVADVWLMQSHEAGASPAMLQWPELIALWDEHDLAVLKVDFSRNADKACLLGHDAFPFVPVDLAPQEEAAPVYAFGYPLPTWGASALPGGTGVVGQVGLGSRVTSAIISATLETTRPVQTSDDSKVYVLDKALNYGNSGGPIVNAETGKAFAVCARFQPVHVPQESGSYVMVPSLYGVATSLANVSDELRGLNPSLA